MKKTAFTREDAARQAEERRRKRQEDTIRRFSLIHVSQQTKKREKLDAFAAYLQHDWLGGQDDALPTDEETGADLSELIMYLVEEAHPALEALLFPKHDVKGLYDEEEETYEEALRLYQAVGKEGSRLEAEAEMATLEAKIDYNNLTGTEEENAILGQIAEFEELVQPRAVDTLWDEYSANRRGVRAYVTKVFQEVKQPVRAATLRRLSLAKAAKAAASARRLEAEDRGQWTPGSLGASLEASLASWGPDGCGSFASPGEEEAWAPSEVSEVEVSAPREMGIQTTPSLLHRHVAREAQRQTEDVFARLQADFERQQAELEAQYREQAEFNLLEAKAALEDQFRKEQDALLASHNEALGEAEADKQVMQAEHAAALQAKEDECLAALAASIEQLNEKTALTITQKEEEYQQKADEAVAALKEKLAEADKGKQAAEQTFEEREKAIREKVAQDIQAAREKLNAAHLQQEAQLRTESEQRVEELATTLKAELAEKDTMIDRLESQHQQALQEQHDAFMEQAEANAKANQEALQQDFDQRIEDMQKEYAEKQRDLLVKQQVRLEEVTAQLQAEHEATLAEQERALAEQHAQALDEARGSIQASADDRLEAEREAAISKQKAELATLTAQHSAALEEKTAAFNQQVAELEAGLKEQLVTNLEKEKAGILAKAKADAEEKTEEEVKQIQARAAAEVEAAKAALQASFEKRFNSERLVLGRAHKTQLEEAEAAHKAQLAEKTRELEALAAQHEAALAEKEQEQQLLVQQLAAREAELKEQYAQEITKLQQEHEVSLQKAVEEQEVLFKEIDALKALQAAHSPMIEHHPAAAAAASSEENDADDEEEAFRARRRRGHLQVQDQVIDREVTPESEGSEFVTGQRLPSTTKPVSRRLEFPSTPRRACYLNTAGKWTFVLGFAASACSVIALAVTFGVSDPALSLAATFAANPALSFLIGLAAVTCVIGLVGLHMIGQENKARQSVLSLAAKQGSTQANPPTSGEEHFDL